MPTLQKRLAGATANRGGGTIDLHRRFLDIRDAAERWLHRGQNDIGHSKRLEGYLNKLTEALSPEQLNPGEIFALLCAVYLHDIGRAEGKDGHEKRSQVMIEANPGTYLLDDFLIHLDHGRIPRVAEAVGQVCWGHAKETECPLSSIDDEFPDANLSLEPGERPLNLRLLVSLLRVADEADDPYTCNQDHTSVHFRNHVGTVSVGPENIIWHCGGRISLEDWEKLEAERDLKADFLKSAIGYLYPFTGVKRRLILEGRRPPRVRACPYMPEPPVLTFVGRDADLKIVHQALANGGEVAVTGLVGAGGIGKTELARMYAWRHRSAYPDGVFWASFISKEASWRREAERILGALGEAVPSGLKDEEAAKQVVAARLRNKRALLILDNVTERTQLLRPGCALLVTTRERDTVGDLPSGTIHGLARLSPKEGLRLLRERAGKDRVEGDLEGARSLVELLGGMPLALDIAGKQLAAEPSQKITEYLGLVSRRLEHLTDVDRNVWACLETSLDRLGAASEGGALLDLFDAVAVCAATGFGPECLIAAAGQRTGSGKLVGRLYMSSLLDFDSSTQRYGAHTLLRHLAEERLGSDPDRERHFRKNHCLYWLEYTQAHAADPSALIAEKDSLWQAMVQANQTGEAERLMPRFLEALSQPYQRHLHRKEYRQAFQYLIATDLVHIEELGLAGPLTSLLAPLLGHLESLEEIVQVILLNGMGSAHHALGNYKEATRFWKQQHDIARSIGDVQGEANALGNIGVANKNLGGYGKAIKLYEQQLKLARRIDDTRGAGNAFGNMGLAYACLGDYRKAIKFYKKQLETTRRVSDKRGESNALGNMAVAYKNLAVYDKAADLLNQALEIDRRIGDVNGESVDLGNIGVLYARQGNHLLAISFFKQQLILSERIYDKPGQSRAFCNMILSYFSGGNFVKAVECYNHYLKIGQRINDQQSEGFVLIYVALSYIKLKNKDKACECLGSARTIFERLGLPNVVAQVERMKEAAGLTG